MKLVFFGTSSFGLPALQELNASHHRILAVVTTPDKAQGRNLLLQPSPVKSWALAQKLPVHEVDKNSIGSLSPTLRAYEADLFVVISFGVILPKTILEMSPQPALNVHSSLLPLYRGPAPIHWALWNGDAQTGVTVMRMAETLDTGDLLLQKSIPILPADTRVTLESRLASLGAKALLESLDQIQTGPVHWNKQDPSQATYARKIKKEDAKILWQETAGQTERRVRALAGGPGTYTFWNQKRILILEARAVESGAATRDFRPGQIAEISPSEGLLVVGTGQKGFLRIERLQMEGKKPLSTADFLRGNPLRAGDILD